MAVGKAEAVAEKRAGVGASMDKAVNAPTRAVVARPRLLVAIAAAPKPPAEALQWSSAISVARRAIDIATAQRSHVADGMLGGTLQIPATRPRRNNAVDATDTGTLLISAPRRNKKLCWRWRARLGQGMTTKTKVGSRTQPERRASAVMVRGRGVSLAVRRRGLNLR